MFLNKKKTKVISTSLNLDSNSTEIPFYKVMNLNFKCYIPSGVFRGEGLRGYISP